MAIWCRENLIWMHETHNDDSHQHNAPPQSCQNVLHVGPAVSSIRIFSSRVEKNMKKSIWLGESVRTPLKLKCFKWPEEASSPSPTEGWRPMLGYVLCSPSRMSMHTNPTSCQKCRSTSHRSFVHQGCVYYFRKFLSILQTSMLKCWFLRTRKSLCSRCFGCKVHKKVGRVFLGSSPKNVETRWVKLHEQRRVAFLNQGRSSCTLSVRSQRSHVLCARNATLANFPKLSRVHVPKLCRSRCLSAHWSSCPSTRQEGGRGAKAFWNLGWVGSRSIGVKRRVGRDSDILYYKLCWHRSALVVFMPGHKLVTIQTEIFCGYMDMFIPWHDVM